MKPGVIQKCIPNADTLKEIIVLSYQYNFQFLLILRSTSIKNTAFSQVKAEGPAFLHKR